MAKITPEQMAAVQALFESVQSVGDGQRGIKNEVLTNFARNEPELAAAACEAMLQAAEVSKGFGTLAIALAAAYQAVFDDDTLTVLVRDHYAALGQPVPEPRFHHEVPPEPVPPAHYEVSEDALAARDIYPLLKLCSHRHLAEGESLDRLRRLGGRLFVTFPIPLSDPRQVWEVPEVRAYVRAIAAAMPYFPFYLAPEPSFAMFEVYFGSLVDLSLLKGGTFDLLDDVILPVVAGALLTTERFADIVGADGEACVRTLLGVFSDEMAELMVRALREAREELPDS
jgi:hypothetical protein